MINSHNTRDEVWAVSNFQAAYITNLFIIIIITNSRPYNNINNQFILLEYNN